MVSSQFGALLKELEPFFKCTLEPDNNNSCLVTMGTGISIQMEMNGHGLLLLGCRIGVLPSSRYRDNLIKQALQTNDLSSKESGIIGFSQKSNQLILFLKVDPAKFTSEQILSLLPPFITKAQGWKEAIAKGEMPALQESSSQKPAGIFGLI